MDRRYICANCGTKWFIPATHSDAPALTACDACHGPLIAFVDDAARRVEAAAGCDRGE